MKKSVRAAALAVIASTLLLSSCDVMFQNNLFSSLDKPNYSFGSLSGIKDALADSWTRVYAMLKSDPAQRDQVVQTLSASPDPQDQVAAAGIIIGTSTSGAQDVVTQAPAALSYLTGIDRTNPPPDDTILATAIGDVLPTSANPLTGGTFANFSALVSDLSSAAAIFSGVVVTTTTDPTTGVTTYSMPAMPGMTQQDTALYALVSICLTSVTSTDPNVSDTQALWDAISAAGAGQPVTGISISGIYDTTTGQPSQQISDLLGVMGLGS